MLKAQRAAAFIALLLCSCSRREAPTPAALQPTAPPKIVYVVVTPTAASVQLELAWTPEPEQPTPAYETAIIEHRIPSPAPTIDIAAIPNQDRPRAPTPAWRTQQMERCLSFTADQMSQPAISGSIRAKVRVRARNDCDSFITADESWFELVSTSVSKGSPVGREVGRFHFPIPPRSRDSETTMEIDCPPDLPGGCRFTASVWWAAGGGRQPQ